MTDMDIEKEIVAKGKTAARVTPERIEAVISGEFYFTGADGISQLTVVAEAGRA